MLKKCALFCFLLSLIIYGENYISLQPIILDYSYGAIYSKELKGANHNRQLMSSYGVGVGVSYGNLHKAFYAKLKFDYNNHKYNILKDSVDSKDLALIFSLSFGPDFLLKNCVLHKAASFPNSSLVKYFVLITGWKKSHLLKSLSSI